MLKDYTKQIIFICASTQSQFLALYQLRPSFIKQISKEPICLNTWTKDEIKLRSVKQYGLSRKIKMNNIYVFSKIQNFYAKTNSAINEYFNLGTILYLSMDKGKFYLDLGQVSSLCYVQTHVTHLVCNKTCYVMGQKVVELQLLLLPLKQYIA